MKRLMSILIITLLSLQIASSSVNLEYSVELNSEYTWKLDYSRSEGTGTSFKETIINGTISSNITQVSDQGIFADLTSLQYIDGDTSYINGLVKLLEGNISNQLISVSGNITDIFFDSTDDYIPFIWPINGEFWDMIIPNFNRSYAPDYEGQYESSSILLTNGKYRIDRFKDDSPVDGGRNNASITINSTTGIMEELIISESYFYTINPPVIIKLKITLVDNDYTFPENSNSLNYPGMYLALVFIAMLSLIIRSTKNRRL